jgi:hypothetical protein
MELQARNIISYFIKTSDNKHDYTFKIKSKEIIIYYKNTQIYYYNFFNKESKNKLTKISKWFKKKHTYYTRPMLETQYKRIYSFLKQVNLNKVIKKSYRFRLKNKNMQKYTYEYYNDYYELSHYNLYYYKYTIYIKNIHNNNIKAYLLLINLFFDSLILN